MANTTSYYYWVDNYTPVPGGWQIDSYLAHREYPNESLLTAGVLPDTPDTGQYQRLRGPVIRSVGMTDAAFDALIQPYKDSIPPTPFNGSSSS
jgi:hypothetical protein